MNGFPIAGVMVAVQGARAFSVSDSGGVFALAGLPPGRRTVRVSYGDSLSYDQALTLNAPRPRTAIITPGMGRPLVEERTVPSIRAVVSRCA